MRAIIIDDKDAKALVSELELAKFGRFLDSHETISIREKYNMTEGEIRFLVSNIHRAFHYKVVKWLQEQGASTT